jgi:ABC-type Fe3+ transport system permease subunit
VGLVLGCALVALGVRTLAEDAYRDYLTTILMTLVTVAVLLFLCTIGAWVAEARRRARARRDSAKAGEAPRPPVPTGPGPEVPQQQAP